MKERVPMWPLIWLSRAEAEQIWPEQDEASLSIHHPAHNRFVDVGDADGGPQ